MALSLTHNGSEVDLAASHCELGSLVRSFAAPATLTLRRAIAFDEPTDWQNEDAVALLLDGTTLFEGRIKSSERVASADGEHILYTCAGPRDQADGIPFQRAIGGTVTARVVYNCPPEEDLPEAGYVANPGVTSTVGEILADILDTMAAALAGLIGDGTPGSGYVQADLDALAAVPPKVVLGGESVDEAIRTVLRHAPDFGYTVDPSSHKARFVDFRTLAPIEIAGVGGQVIRHGLDFSTAGCYSACTVQGSYELIDVFEQLTPAWSAAYETGWTSELAAKYPDTYGKVWRLFTTTAAVLQGGVVMPQRFIGEGDIIVLIGFSQLGQSMVTFASATVVDDTKLLLNAFARKWLPSQSKFGAATVYARYTYRKARVAGRYPASGHAGTAHSRRGLTRELFLIEEQRGKKTIKGTVGYVPLGSRFATFYELARPGQLAGMTVQFNGDGIEHAIADNDVSVVTLEEAPATPIQPNDTFVITAQDDTRKDFEGGTLSILEKYAKETLERVMDERFVGRVPLAALDWSLALGQKVSFTGTNDPDYESLGATLLAVEHDLARQQTLLTLTSERAGGVITWGELERQRQRDRDVAEHTIQIHRLWRRLRGRHAEQGGVGDPFQEDDYGPYTGDNTWIGVEDKLIRHIGPGPARTSSAARAATSSGSRSTAAATSSARGQGRLRRAWGRVCPAPPQSPRERGEEDGTYGTDGTDGTKPPAVGRREPASCSRRGAPVHSVHVVHTVHPLALPVRGEARAGAAPAASLAQRRTRDGR